MKNIQTKTQSENKYLSNKRERKEKIWSIDAYLHIEMGIQQQQKNFK